MIKTLFIDLHGVLVDPVQIFQNYNSKIAEILKPVGITSSMAKDIHKSAFNLWVREFEKAAKDLKATEDEKFFLQIAQELDLKYTEYILQFLPSDNANIKKIRSQIEADQLEYESAKYKSALFPQTFETLVKLRKNFTGNLICASDAHSRHVRGCLKAGKIIDFFNDIIGYDQVGCTKITPKNCYLRRILKLCKVSPEKSLFIDDRVNFLENAISLGAKSILIRKCSTDTTKNPSIIVLDNFYKIVDILDSL